MNKKLAYFLLLGVPLLIYFPSFQYFFFQDDFLHLKRSWVEGPMAILGFFKPPSGAIFYRPLSLQIYFYLTRTLFGLNPLAFRIIAFSFFLMSIILLKKVIKKITGDEVLSFTVALLFGISSIHFMSLFWICEFSVILGTFFLLLSLLYYPKKPALLFFFLGLLSHELVIILPILLFFTESLFKKRNFRNLLPFSVLAVLYLIFRFLLFPMPLEGTYRPTLGRKNINAFLWYLLWAFNLPEELKYQAFFSILVRKQFIISFLKESIIWVSFLLIILIFSLVFPLVLIKRRGTLPQQTRKFLFFGILWFLAMAVILVLTPHHQYPMYLSFGLPGFYLALVSGFFSSLKGKTQKIILPLLLACFLVLSLTTIRFTEKTHWAVKEANKAELIINMTKKDDLKALKGVIFLLPDDQELKAALNDQDAFEVFYGRKAEVFYGEEKDLKYRQDLEGFKILKLDGS